MKKAGIFAGAVFTASVMASLFYLGKQKYRKQFESQKIKELESVQSKPISVSQKWGRTSSILTNYRIEECIFKIFLLNMGIIILRYMA